MGKTKKGYNWKARVQVETAVERSQNVTVDLAEIRADQGYGDSNTLALPSWKSTTKKKAQNVPKVKRLSKKERKKLEKVLEQKEKKTKRASLLESLSEVQASPEEMKLFTGIAEVQTGKHKRKSELSESTGTSVNTIAGSNKRQKFDKDEEEDTEDSVDTSDMSSEEEEEEEEGITEEQQPSKGDQSEPLDIGEGDNFKQHDTDSGLDDEDEGKVKHKVGTDECKVNKEVRSSAGTDTQTDTKVAESKPAVHIPVKRKKEIQEARLKLPILAEEQVIMEAIAENPVVIICGETGSGKTTQVPQFLYEAGYAHGNGVIGVTEPRRVAAISMSERVGTEMNFSPICRLCNDEGDQEIRYREVSYQIRYEGNVTEKTKIKFMTDGVLLKEVQQDFLLTKYSVIIIDEAHERSMYTDILIGLLSRIVPLRQKRGNPLKLIIMSATLRVEDFTENKRLFKVTPPVIKVESRQYPVTIHFNKRTPLDSYLQEAYKKTCKIHRMLPEGGILVFVTGQQEVHTLCRKLRQTFPYRSKQVWKKGKQKLLPKKEDSSAGPKQNLPNINLDNYSVAPLDEEAQREEDLDAEADDEEGLDKMEEADINDNDDIQEGPSSSEPLYVLPLYSLLPTYKQAKVFKPPPEGCRLCVVATNVAETSLTIPNIKYVIDTGKVKTKYYDKVTGVSTFRITWTSKAGANQRAGRAGRVGPGHCYRLYSSAMFNDDFEKFSAAEITKRPVDDLVLQMKDMNIEKVINFPYPTPPDIEQIKAAERLLTSLGALTTPEKPKSFKDTKKEPVTKITSLGKAMACFPVSPRYAKMLALGHQHGLLPYVIVIVSALSVQELLTETFKPPDEKEESEILKRRLQHLADIKRRWAGMGHSLLLGDLMVLLKAVGSCEFEGCTPQFCEKHGIRFKAMKEVRKLRVQLTNAANSVIPDANVCVDPKMAPPSDLQAKLLRQIVLAGLADHVARKLPDTPTGSDGTKKKVKRAYQCPELEEPVFIHPTSVLNKQPPDYVVYQHIEETSKLYMKGIVAVEPEWFPLFAPSHCTLSKPLDKPPPDYDDVKGQVVCHMTSTFGLCSWPVPAVELEHPAGLDRLKWFARFLLEGKVVPKLKKYSTSLLSLPSTMVKTWAKLQPRTDSLLKALASEGVDCRDNLLKVWRKNPKYLLTVYLEWIPESLHGAVRNDWPPVT